MPNNTAHAVGITKLNNPADDVGRIMANNPAHCFKTGWEKQLILHVAPEKF